MPIEKEKAPKAKSTLKEKNPKDNIPNCKIPNGNFAKGGDFVGEGAKGKYRGGKAIRATTMIWERRHLSLIEEEMMTASIILQIRRGGRIGYRWAQCMRAIIGIRETRGGGGLGVSRWSVARNANSDGCGNRCYRWERADSRLRRACRQNVWRSTEE